MKKTRYLKTHITPEAKLSLVNKKACIHETTLPLDVADIRGSSQMMSCAEGGVGSWPKSDFS